MKRKKCIEKKLKNRNDNDFFKDFKKIKNVMNHICKFHLL